MASHEMYQGNPEVRSRALEWYENFNKITFVGALGFAAVASFVAPELVVPALALAAFDGAQIYIINKLNKKKPEQRVVYQSEASLKAA